jgi:uracil-DNA glycosylase
MKTLTQAQQQFFNAIPDSWKDPLKEICSSPAIDNLVHFLKEREAAGATIYPAKQNIFAALRATPFDDVKVVIVGQDPYHGLGQAQGLCFSVPEHIPHPPSLRNIFKELHSDIGATSSRDLTCWARQGVLLLNAILTVEESSPAAHAGKGWELFTDEIIKKLIERKSPLVLILWGAYAQKKVQNVHAHIDPTVHLILKAGHPSPLSVTKFLGCRHFSQANTFLTQHNEQPINWACLK